MAAKRNRARKSAKHSRKGAARRVTTRGTRNLHATNERSWPTAARSSREMPLEGKAVLITGAARRARDQYCFALEGHLPAAAGGCRPTAFIRCVEIARAARSHASCGAFAGVFCAFARTVSFRGHGCGL